MKRFEEYIKEGVVRVQHKDIQRAESLKKEAAQRKIFLQKMIDKLGIDDENANYIIETCYDIIMKLIRAKLLQEGYNASGAYAHEAEIAYLISIRYPYQDIKLLDELRYKRNGITYYGKITTKEYATKIKVFMMKLYERMSK